MQIQGLDTLLNAYFGTIEAPLVPPGQTNSLLPKAQANDVSLGDGRSIETAKGLENIILFASDSSTPTNMRDWMNAAIGKGKDPNQIADEATELLRAGRAIYYQEGQLRPTRLRIDESRTRLEDTGLGREGARPRKPRRTPAALGRAILRRPQGNEAETYRQRMSDYNMERYADRLVKSRVGLLNTPLTEEQQKQRTEQEAEAKKGYAWKGRGTMVGQSSAEELAQKQREFDVEKQQVEATKLTQQLREREKILQERAVEREQTQQRERKQQAFEQKVAFQKDNTGVEEVLAALKKSREGNPRDGRVLPELKEMVAKTLMQAMETDIGNDVESQRKYQEKTAALQETGAFRNLMASGAPRLIKIIESNQLFDKFAGHLMQAPTATEFPITNKNLQSLKDFCHEPPRMLVQLTAALTHAENVKNAQNLRPEAKQNVAGKKAQEFEDIRPAAHDRLAKEMGEVRVASLSQQRAKEAPKPKAPHL